MATYVQNPSKIEACGDLPKIIEEFFGRVSTETEAISIARMKSPEGWSEPRQRPAFDEYTVVLKGTLRVATHCETIAVTAGQAVLSPKGEWVQYSTPFEGGAEYIAVCLPAFSPDTVHRDEE